MHITQEISEKVTAVLSLIGDPLNPDPRWAEHRDSIVSRMASGHGRFHFRVDGDRLKISAAPVDSLIEFAPRPDPRRAITVSLAKSPERIAKDVQRVLLPLWNSFLAQTLATRERYEKSRNVKREAIQPIAEALGGEVRGNSDAPSCGFSADGCRLDFTAHGSMDIRGWVPHALGLQIAQLVAKYYEK